jgi:myosin heavy subunit
VLLPPQVCVDLFERRSGGLLGVLVGELAMDSCSDDTVAASIARSIRDDPCLEPSVPGVRQLRQCQNEYHTPAHTHDALTAVTVGLAVQTESLFAVRHYHGRVVYSCSGFTDTCRDELSSSVSAALRSSSSAFVASLFPLPASTAVRTINLEATASPTSGTASVARIEKPQVRFERVRCWS